MNPAAAKRLRLLASVTSVLVVLLIAAGFWFYSRLRASLPQLDGTESVHGLGAAVTIERDALGVPTIRAQSRVDAARALGWLHAQDRFFQMDLFRRSAAGELAEVFGARAVPRDRAVRIHGFRALAQQVVARLPAEHRAILEAYTAGVNAGLAALGAKPFEYYVVRETPQPWRVEDCVLVHYAMTLTLQDGTGRYEKTLMTLRDQFGSAGLGFFDPLVAPDDAALDGSSGRLAPIPGPDILNLRATKLGAHSAPHSRARGRGPEDRLAPDSFPFPAHDRDGVLGSNAFALAGAHTANGAALVANDMHLDLGVPNTWYRAALEFPGHSLIGLTLPGVPAFIAGSNGHIAWGFTDAFVDTSDLVVVEMEPGLTEWYVVPGNPGSAQIEQRHEVIRVKGGRDVAVDYRWTRWGPIVGTNDRQQPLALRWTEHDPAATNFDLLALEDAPDVAAGLAIAHHSGIPALNILIADAAGDIGWTIAGFLPKRVGYDGRLPVSWAYGDRHWDGFVAPDDVPVVTTRPSGRPAEISARDGRLWSANQREIGGAALAILGDGGYHRPNRAAQIRDDLAPLEHAAPRDLLAVQLDDRALFLAPWHRLLLDTLTPAVTAQKKPRAALRTFAEPWDNRASLDAVSYPIVKQFRQAVYERVFDPIFAACRDANPEFDADLLHLEPAIWTLLREKPKHLLDPKFATWDDLLVAAADDVIAFLDRQAITLPRANWGLRNTVRIRHPFSYSFPDWATGWMNMPADSLPGDVDMPRVQTPTHGASERLVVSPGHEAEGIFNMPGGESGHPLSPYFRAGHAAWARGEPTPLRSGKTEHTLRLTP
ncbi:MAG TPA: penicillin acylase family protein [Opitutaceae bacterium]|nr:penicillin acylase family protein [Opitutaceae bacterium]